MPVGQAVLLKNLSGATTHESSSRSRYTSSASPSIISLSLNSAKVRSFDGRGVDSGLAPVTFSRSSPRYRSTDARLVAAIGLAGIWAISVVHFCPGNIVN